MVLALLQTGLILLLHHHPLDAAPEIGWLNLNVGIESQIPDTLKYNGYRLELLNFEVLKVRDAWVLLRFDIVNSGRENIDFKQSNHGYWVQFNFDPSFINKNLKPLQENIQQALISSSIKIEAGKFKKKFSLKVSNKPLPKTTEKAKEWVTDVPPPRVTTGHDSREPTTPLKISGDSNLRPCPDIYFSDLFIVSQNNRMATLQYTVTNKGEGPFVVIHPGTRKTPSIIIRFFISGVPELSRGAIPVGEFLVVDGPGLPHLLKPGESFSGHLDVNVRKKTRYLKSLILSLDNDQFGSECDKTNNSKAVTLD
jgi:hypothetical protein